MKIQWNNPASVTAALTAMLGTVVGIVATIHPGFTVPTVVQASLGSVGFLIAGAAGLAHVWHKTSTKVARIQAGIPTEPTTTPGGIA